jgi:hypothetical protein
MRLHFNSLSVINGAGKQAKKPTTDYFNLLLAF